MQLWPHLNIWLAGTNATRLVALEEGYTRNAIFNLWISADCLWSNWQSGLRVRVGVMRFLGRGAVWRSTTSSQSFPLCFWL